MKASEAIRIGQVTPSRITPDSIRQRKSSGKTNTLFSTFQNKETLCSRTHPSRSGILFSRILTYVSFPVTCNPDIPFLQTGFSSPERKSALTEFNRNVSGRQEFWRLNKSTQSKGTENQSEVRKGWRGFALAGAVATVHQENSLSSH
ncbi:hypothetical protein CDAR_101911 [Caerostris darwini]|uniref:Uncharacterized protein n=1 Tax=Caerostris darwini TaxID=1538125 RepID=A0AAV4TDG6_9ARAC|nr:hypothetical protein CDAR_101911 [Caerostris darwini]